MSGQNKRLECPGAKASLQVVSKPIPEAPLSGLVVKNHYSGICHSDVHTWQSGFVISDTFTAASTDLMPNFTYPAIFGHEMSGEVYSLGAEYKGELKVGDLVAVSPWTGCQECGPCKAGDTLMCPAFFSFCPGFGVEGGFQHYTAISQGYDVLKVLPGIPMPSASIMTCSGITALKAVNKIIPAVERAIKNTGAAKVLIIGAGGVGLWGINWAKALLPPQAKVFVADISDEKLKGGLAQGADEGILWDRAAAEADLIQLTKEKLAGGLDGSVDFVGLAATSGRAVQCASKGATCVTVGLAGGEMRVMLVPMVLSEVRVEGSLVGKLHHLADAMKIFKEKNVKVPPVTFVPPEDIERCLLELKAGTFQGRYVVDWTKQ
jgi:propanol-preferring alcohol dehydrogenase